MVRKKLTYPIYSPYAEDVWKILPRLTLTAGVRYSYMPFAKADQGYATAFDPAKFDPSAAPGVTQTGALVLTPNYNPVNGLIYNGLNGVPLNLSNAHKNYISPSVGFAWDIYGNGRVSIRGGYAINYLKSGSSSDCQDSCIGQPAVTQINLTGSNFPNPLNGQTTVPSAPNIFGEDIHNIQAAKIHSYSLSVQQEFGTNWWIEIAGAGVAGRNLPLGTERESNAALPGLQLQPPNQRRWNQYGVLRALPGVRNDQLRDLHRHRELECIGDEHPSSGRARSHLPRAIHLVARPLGCTQPAGLRR